MPDDDPYKKMYDIGQDRAKARVNKSGNLLFHGESASSRARCASRELCQGSVPGQFSCIATGFTCQNGYVDLRVHAGMSASNDIWTRRHRQAAWWPRCKCSGKLSPV